MIKTIPVIYRSGVFVPMTAVDKIAEETPLEIAVYLPVDEEAETEDVIEDVSDYSLEQNLALLYQTAGQLHSNLPVDEVRYLVESVQLAEENIWIETDRDFRRIPDVTLWIP